MPANIIAILGPTNTGKTHRAIERMLELPTGMIGLPLRLLAREVYDRVSTRVGESQVALVTGEEKRIPPRPRYWVATVEAMPVDQPVDFVAIDEVQLVASPERGHVFTDRVLHLRGSEETWLLGSEVARSWLSDVLPDVEFRTAPRLSTLTAQRPLGLRALPRRTAVIAFSLPRVFELARALRKHRGGAAVVVGAMSPRTRNAQVAMYESGEVDFVVATDAIGMGLNLDIEHVAFSELEKFDGKESRPLEPAELAQIAGRAGRYTKNGTFGALAPLDGIPKDVARRVEEHRFAPLGLATYRSSELSFDSVTELAESLHQPPPHARMRRVRDAADERAFQELAASDGVSPLLVDPTTIQLLWQVACIPDYRQLLFSLHTQRLEEIFLALATRSRLDPVMIERQLQGLGQTSDDPETLLDRIADVRLWNYVANQAGWVDPASGVLERARAVEDELSDQLHRAVLARFGPSQSAAAPRRDVPKASPSSPFASLARLLDRGAPAAPPSAPGNDIDRLVDAPHESFSVDEQGRVSWDGRVVGRITRGREITAPDGVVTMELGAGARLQVHRRLIAFARDLVADLLGGLERSHELSPAARGVLYAVRTGLGTWRLEGLSIADEDRAALGRFGLVVGTFSVFSPALLRPRAVEKRRLLVRTFHADEFGAAARLPTGKEVTLKVDARVPPKVYEALGYLCLARRAVRADIAERLAGEPLADATGLAAARVLGCSRPEGLAIVEALGRATASRGDPSPPVAAR